MFCEIKNLIMEAVLFICWYCAYFGIYALIHMELAEQVFVLLGM